MTSNQNIDPNIAEVRAALSCWRHGTWSKAYAMEQFEKLLQGFVDRGPVETTPVTSAARDVLAERSRQISAEGWTPEHDARHARGQMAQAAACYALRATPHKDMAHDLWPWEDSWWKPKDVRRDMVRAAALLLAEIERFDRWNADPNPGFGFGKRSAVEPTRCTCVVGKLNWCAVHSEKATVPLDREAVNALALQCAQASAVVRNREWNFDRYRNGKLKAQGIRVHAATEAEAWEKARSLLHIDGNLPTDELRLQPLNGGAEQI